MSITVRQWNARELQDVLLGKDPKLETILVNMTSFLVEEIRVYNQLVATGRVKSYIAYFDDQVEAVRFKAPNDEMANWFLSQEYTVKPVSLEEAMTTYRKVEIQ